MQEKKRPFCSSTLRNIVYFFGQILTTKKIPEKNKLILTYEFPKRYVFGYLELESFPHQKSQQEFLFIFYYCCEYLQYVNLASCIKTTLLLCSRFKQISCFRYANCYYFTLTKGDVQGKKNLTWINNFDKSHNFEKKGPFPASDTRNKKTISNNNQ